MRWTRLAILPAAGMLASCSSKDATSPQVQALVDYVLNVCNPAAFVAVQAQIDGPWTPVTFNSANSATIPLGEKFGLAIVRQNSATSYSSYITYITKTELPSATTACTTPLAKTVNGSISALSAGQESQVTMDGRNSYLTPGTTAFSLVGVRDNKDVFAQRRVASTGLSDKFIVRRNQNPAANSTMAALDFAGGEAVNPTTAAVTIAGVGASELRELSTSLYTTGGLFAYFNSPAATSTSGTIYGLPAATGVATDRHVVSLYVHNNSYSSQHGVDVFQAAIAPLTITVGAAMNTPTVTVDNASPKRLRLQLASQSDYGKQVEFYYYLTSGGIYRDINIVMTSGYKGGTPTTWDVTAPSLTGLAGYPANADMPNASAMWSVNVYGNIEYYWNATTSIADGTVVKWAYEQSSVAAIMAPDYAGNILQPQNSAALGTRRMIGARMSPR